MTPRTNDPDRWLADILEAIAAIRLHRARGDLDDGLVFDAVRMRLIEIGEAVKSLPEELLMRQPQIPWRSVRRMRDVLTHHYFGTLLSEVEATVTNDLQPLEDAVQALRSGKPAGSE